MPVADYRCENCGERYPLMLEALIEVVVGGITAHRFATHGPGCNHQVFKRIWDAPHTGRGTSGKTPPR